jgi:hypothetical protein
MMAILGINTKVNGLVSWVSTLEVGPPAPIPPAASAISEEDAVMSVYNYQHFAPADFTGEGEEPIIEQQMWLEEMAQDLHHSLYINVVLSYLLGTPILLTLPIGTPSLDNFPAITQNFKYESQVGLDVILNDNAAYKDLVDYFWSKVKQVN